MDKTLAERLKDTVNHDHKFWGNVNVRCVECEQIDDVCKEFAEVLRKSGSCTAQKHDKKACNNCVCRMDCAWAIADRIHKEKKDGQKS